MRSAWPTVRKVSRCVGVVTRLALRKVRLQILTQLAEWKRPKDEPQIVLYKNRGIAMLSGSLPHIVPLSAVLVLLVLNLNSFFIGNLPTAAVTAFQFVAKALELLMQASLAVILHDTIRWQIVRNEDFPLGGLVAPLRTTDISYLFSLEFWGALTSKNWRGYRKVYLGLLIFAIVVLAALVGPSGAVASIPRQSTRPSGQALQILDPADLLFPRSVSYLDTGVDFELAMGQLYQAMSQLDHQTGATIRLLDSNGTRQLRTLPDIGLMGGFVATIPSRFMSYTLQTEARILDPYNDPGYSVTMRTSQPLVHSNCALDYLYTGDNRETTYIPFPSLDGTAQQTHILSWGEAFGNVTGVTGEEFLHFKNLPLGPPSRRSTFMAYGVLKSEDSGFAANVLACTFEATWTNATLSASVTNDYLQVDFVPETRYNGSIPQDQIVDLPQAWTDRVRSAILANSDAFGAFQSAPAYQANIPAVIALLLSNDKVIGSADNSSGCGDPNDCWDYSADGALLDYVSRKYGEQAGWDASIDVSNKDCLSDPDSLTYQVVTQTLQGYGYSTEGTTVQLSLVVLGLYCAFVLTHISVLVWTGYTGTSWDSIGELLMLGLMSRQPEHLNPHVSAGLETFKTLREPVSVKVNGEGHVELVFANDTGSKSAANDSPVMVNEAY